MVKKIILFIMVILFLSHCTSENIQNDEELIFNFSGIVTNTDITGLRVDVNGIGTILPINENGYFSGNLFLSEPGIFEFYFNFNHVYPLYAAPGDSLVIHFDHYDFINHKTIDKVDTPHKIEQNFLTTHGADLYKYVGDYELQSKGEEEYLAGLNKVVSTIKSSFEKYQKSNKVSPEFASYYLEYLDDAYFYAVKDYMNYQKNSLSKDSSAFAQCNIEYKNYSPYSKFHNNPFYYKVLDLALIDDVEKLHYTATESQSTWKDYTISDKLSFIDGLHLRPEVENYLGFQSLYTSLNSLRFTDDYFLYKREFIDKDSTSGYSQSIINLERKIEHVMPGKMLPEFDFLNVDNERISLNIFGGNFVYIDIWATWCFPCTMQHKHLKNTISHFQNYENLIFVGVSIDKNVAKWKSYVAKDESEQIQLLSPNGWDSDFYNHLINAGIPRFILLGPDGSIVQANLKYPSDAESISELESLVQNWEGK